MKIAIVHDWLTGVGGGERVLEQMLECFPDADVFTLIDVLEEKDRWIVKNKPVKTSFIQHLPFAKRLYRNYLMFMPLAIEQLDVTQYDVVLSSCHAVSKGVMTGPNQVHVSYVHSPIRYAWDLQHQYLQEAGLTRGLKSWIARKMLHYIRMWDYRTGSGVDNYIANSRFIGRRIKKVYGRDSEVIYPPVDTSAFTLKEQKEDFYLTASRMVPYKKIPLIVEAFSKMPDKKLVVIGAGPEFDQVKAVAGPNVSVLGYQPFEVLKDHMQRAKAFVFAAEEDFGITPVEALACGTPVIAYGKGGVTESVRGLGADKPTGVFFPEQTIDAIVEAIAVFEREGASILPANCRERALLFSPEVFRRQLVEKVNMAIEARQKEILAE
ncbi:glycosyltransferase family 4 protein [Chitinivorax sp. PXF-14]|uniref:glycosyltransferase family 4 protein n=1 Tax=Chitinivorax sp. PXF-14 TaxID=3230488 RepID=UPI00346549F3